MKKEIKIGNIKIDFKFKLGWKEVSKKERIGLFNNWSNNNIFNEIGEKINWKKK